MQVLARAQRRNIAKLTPLIGAEAARLAVRGNQVAVAMLALLLFFALPASLWYQEGGPGVVCGGSWLLSLLAGAVSWRVSNDGDRAASAFVSDKLGYGVTLRGGGTNTIRWRRRIDRAMSSHDGRGGMSPVIPDQFRPVDDTAHRAGAPLSSHAESKIRFAASLQPPLPPWNDMLFGERGSGPRALPWDGRFRPMSEFEPRWKQILDATTRDWVNLDVVGVKEGRLLFGVQYLTDDHVKRTWPTHMISVNGGRAVHPEADLLFKNARW